MTACPIGIEMKSSTLNMLTVELADVEAAREDGTEEGPDDKDANEERSDRADAMVSDSRRSWLYGTGRSHVPFSIASC